MQYTVAVALGISAMPTLVVMNIMGYIQLQAPIGASLFIMTLSVLTLIATTGYSILVRIATDNVDRYGLVRAVVRDYIERKV